MSDISTTQSARTWFCVLNSPRTIWGEEATPEEMVNAALDLWMENKPRRSCAGNYEIGDTGNEHMHLVLCDPQKARFSAIQKLFPGIHIEPMRGTKDDAESYIRKTGRFEEKAHTIVVSAIFRGEIVSNQGHRTDLDEVQRLLIEGYTPNEIMDKDVSFWRHEKLIRRAFIRMKNQQTPPLREITVYWHVGKAGSGKTYTYIKLCEERGEDQVYMFSDYSVGGLDHYEAQPVLFVDEFKGRMAFGDLLLMLEGYKRETHCRFENITPMWTEVHLTSVYPPEVLYKLMVPNDQQELDEYAQLARRITYVVYHYKQDGEFKEFQLPMEEYHNYDNLKLRAVGKLPPPPRAEPRHPKEEPQPSTYRQEKMDLVADMDYLEEGFEPCQKSDFDIFLEVQENTEKENKG